MSQQVLSVPEVHCGHCVSSIEEAVGSLSGVNTVKVDLDTKNVTVDLDDSVLSVDEVRKTIEEQGYEVA